MHFQALFRVVLFTLVHIQFTIKKYIKVTDTEFMGTITR